MTGFRCLVANGLLGLRRDKVLWALFSVALLLLVVVPVVSLLSMRQVQELAISLSLSGISFFLLVITVFLGATSIWRDLEKRYAVSIFPLPVSRTSYLLAKFSTLAVFLLFCVTVLGVISSAGIVIASQSYPSERPLLWLNYVAALSMTGFKFLLLLAITFLLSTLSTSFFLPVFGTVAIYLTGSASFEVLQFVLQHPERYTDSFIVMIKFLHYLLPNFAAFDFNVHAVYALPVPWGDLILSVSYALTYGGTILLFSALLLNRREL